MHKDRVQRLYWEDVRNHFKTINPFICDELDKLSPCKKYPLYIMHYNYGDLIGDDKSVLVPKGNSEFYRLGSPETPAQMMEELGYGSENSPLGMFFNKNFEWFLVSSENNYNTTYPVFIDTPGVFFSIGKVINFGYSSPYIPNGILFVAAGSKSNFMLPSIGCETFHSRIQKQYRTVKPVPKNYCEHSEIFSDIVKSRQYTNEWNASVLYFSENWVRSISSDYAWREIKDYFYRISYARSEYAINSEYYSHIFRVSNNRNNLKKNLLLYDTARYLFGILLGVKPGFAPAENNDMLPLNLLQEAYSECYRLQYEPIIMTPVILAPNTPQPVYYSLQHPALRSYSPKPRNASTALTDIMELVGVIEKYQTDFSLPIRECRNTILEQLSKKSIFNFYHSNAQEHYVIKSPMHILENDQRFNISNKEFPLDAKFFKGCASVNLKK